MTSRSRKTLFSFSRKPEGPPDPVPMSVMPAQNDRFSTRINSTRVPDPKRYVIYPTLWPSFWTSFFTGSDPGWRVGINDLEYG